jgi:hypothetical protein
MDENRKWDFFISHAFEDAREIAKPLCDALNAKGLITWYVDYALRAGDRMHASIDYGLARSRYGIVLLTKQFLGKPWTQNELNELATREVEGKRVVLPVWHKVGFRDINGYSPVLADRVAISTEKGLDYLVKRLWDIAKQPSRPDGMVGP